MTVKTSLVRAPYLTYGMLHWLPRIEPFDIQLAQIDINGGGDDESEGRATRFDRARSSDHRGCLLVIVESYSLN